MLKRVLRESLEEGSFEQQSLWQLVLAHRDIKIENWIQVLPSVQSDKHSEVVIEFREFCRPIFLGYLGDKTTAGAL